MKDHHAVTDAEVLDSLSGGHNLAGGFMPKNSWGRMRAGGDFLEISPTDAAGVNAHQNLTAPNLGHRDSLQAHILPATVDGSSHHLGDHQSPDAGLCLCRCLHQPSIFSRASA
jgi:hypothetical protein